MEISTIPYQVTHGKLPKGRGRWAFAMEAYPESPEGIWFSQNLKFADAKKQATEHFAGKATKIYALG